jgi:hypothetical protein
MVGPKLWMLALLFATAAGGGPVRAQAVPSAEERLKILTDPESLKKLEKEKDKDKLRPPLEIFRSQVAPFDVLPYVKPKHWSTIALELRANLDNYAGIVQTELVPLAGMPHAMLYRRDARLLKGHKATLGMQVMLPQVPREMAIELIQPDAIRADETWRASLRILDPHQMLIPVLTKGPNDGYAQWKGFQAFTPTSVDPAEFVSSERQRYYALVLPQEPDRPPLSPHSLTWSTISHVLWDGMTPDTLGPARQQALLDWLHWGGQLILIGGATPSLKLLRDSFLDPYLPADPSGDSVLLGQDELRGLSAEYPPPTRYNPIDVYPVPATEAEARAQFGRYRAAEAIRPAKDKPVYLEGLTPRPGSTTIPLDDSSGRLLGVERRVGRGRILMLAVNPTENALATWLGLDTLVRRVILRRPEERMVQGYGDPATVQAGNLPAFGILAGPDLSWFRLLGRDFASEAPNLDRAKREAEARVKAAAAEAAKGKPGGNRRRTLRNFPQAPVAEWDDTAALPRLCRDELERASGISIPSSTFVLKVILAYLVALVPLNWLICRYLFGRREWAWIVVPVLALGFAVGVERAAAYDMGYDTACDEIDVVEVFAGYPRAHLSRFAALYSTGRIKFSIGFPGDPLALALPLDTGRSLRGEGISTSIWQSSPAPLLDAFSVQPRSLMMFRAEQVLNLAGPFFLQRAGTAQTIVNTGDLELRDAVLVDVGDDRTFDETFIGTIAPGASVPVVRGRAIPAVKAGEGLEPGVFLREFREYSEDRPENRGELRLVGWSPRPCGGLKLTPAVDRHRGFSVVVVHLTYGPPPPPDGPTYK